MSSSINHGTPPRPHVTVSAPPRITFGGRRDTLHKQTKICFLITDVKINLELFFLNIQPVGWLQHGVRCQGLQNVGFIYVSFCFRDMKQQRGCTVGKGREDEG